MELDLEQYAKSFLARMLRTLALGIAGISFLVAGSMFVLFGVVTYMSSFIAASLAWGLVGVGVGACGALFILVARR